MTPDRKDDHIDLNRLTQRELLILTYSKMQTLEENVEKMERQQQSVAEKVAALEGKSKTWGALAGLITGILTILFEKFLSR